MAALQAAIADHSLLDGDYLPANYPGRLQDSAFNNILADIACGISARRASQIHGSSIGVLWRNMAQEPARLDQYARARRLGILIHAEELLEIADDCSGDDGPSGMINVHRAKLRVESRKWLLSKLAPSVYGDRVELTGSADSPLRIVISRDDNDL